MLAGPGVWRYRESDVRSSQGCRCHTAPASSVAGNALAVLRKLRVSLLLAILVVVALGLWTERVRLASWQDPVWVAVYPINAENDAGVAAHIDSLAERDFDPIEAYLRQQAAAHGLALDRAVEVKLAPPVSERPPTPPASGGTLAVMLWSLHMRWWAWRHDTYDGPEEIRIFVLYHAARSGRRLAHSLGLEKARLGVVNGFGAHGFHDRNHVVITHELLHTLGASDKYDAVTGQPIHPEGYAEPMREPLHPQRRAELMGARIPLAPGQSRMPRSLDETTIGRGTAVEIGWSAAP